MKKIISVLLVLILIFTLMGCGSSTNKNSHGLWIYDYVTKKGDKDLSGIYTYNDNGTKCTYVFGSDGTWRYSMLDRQFFLGNYKVLNEKVKDISGNVMSEIRLNNGDFFAGHGITGIYSNYKETKTELVSMNMSPSGPLYSDFIKSSPGIESALTFEVVDNITGVYDESNFTFNSFTADGHLKDIHDVSGFTYTFTADGHFKYINKVLGIEKIQEEGTYTFNNNMIQLTSNADQYGNKHDLGSIYIEKYNSAYIFYRIDNLEQQHSAPIKGILYQKIK